MTDTIKTPLPSGSMQGILQIMDDYAREHARRENAALREVMRRMVSGIEHIDELARQWEPDYSSGADRRGWVLARDAAIDAKRLLGIIDAAQAAP